MKNEVRNDSTTAQFDAIRIILPIATFMPMRLGFINISEAYIQSGPINCKIFLRPPIEWRKTKRGSIWQPQKIPNGGTETGWKWATVIEHCVVNDREFEHVKGFPKIIIKRDEKRVMVMILAKVTDYLLFASVIAMKKSISNKLYNSFKVSKNLIDEPID